MIQEELMIGFYGDDFTGSTDVMEALTLNGVPTALFLQPPDPDDIAKFRLKNSHVSSDRKLKGYGIAGISRRQTPLEMDSELPAVFEKMGRIPSRYVHYKICSTFDSSPHIGNIGHAVEIALRYFPATFVPLIVGIPLLNRFCVFGNLFARVDELTYRIDRHPTMSRHPVTPMDEADLRRHLGKQTKRAVHLIDIMDLDDLKVCKKHYEKLSKQGGYVLFDVLTKIHLHLIGTMLEQGKKNPQQLLVGSSGVEYALCSYWQQSGLANKSTVPISTKKADRYAIIAGSCSPGTAQQIQHGLSLGYVGIRMDSENLIDNYTQEVSRCTEACLNVLVEGGVPMLFSALGPDDPCILTTRDKMTQSATNGATIGARLGGAQGEVLKNIIDQAGQLRVTVAGGDTSGFVTQALGIYALEVLIPIAPGAPLCVAHAKNKKYDGLEMSLKGGQNGNYQYFEFVQLGKATTE